jgi:hypothetical protein
LQLALKQIRKKTLCTHIYVDTGGKASLPEVLQDLGSTPSTKKKKKRVKGKANVAKC